MRETKSTRRARQLVRPAPKASGKPVAAAGKPVAAPKGWLISAVAGVALAGLTGTSILAVADNMPSELPSTDAQGRPQVLGSAGRELIKQFEGFELNGYLLGDGMCTIGYGHAVSLKEMSKDDCKAWKITEAQAEAFLKEDSKKFSEPINEYFSRSFTQNQFDALVSFSYNTGFAYQKYEWPKDAPDSYFPGVMIKYTNPPQFKEGLTRRRNAEIALFKNPSEPAAVNTASAPAPQTSGENVPQESNPQPVAPAQAPAPLAPTVSVPAPVVTQFPDVAPLFSGGLSGR